MINTEIYENNDGNVRIYIAYSSNKFSTGLLILKPGAFLPKHNRPKAIENLTQIYGSCLMKIFDKVDHSKNYRLNPGEGVRMYKGQYHIHSNPYSEDSITLWTAEGDIIEILNEIRRTHKKITTNTPKNPF